MRKTIVLWKVNGNKLEPVPNTAFTDEQFQERDLESWIESNPGILGEPLLLIGRQVVVPNVNDRLDLLALDPSGNTVIIEIKRGKLSDPVDIQAMRYASYVSRWPRRKIEEIAEAYLAQQGGDEGSATFEEVFSEFAAETDTDGVPSLNGRQRMIIVGQKIRTRLGSVALWLREQGIDIKIIEITPYKDPAGTALILSPQLIIPPPSTEEFEVGITKDSTDPWIVDGEKWHLEQRCQEPGRRILQECIRAVGERFPDAQGPTWRQKHYVSFRLGNAVWLYLVTRKKQMNLIIPAPTGKWNSDELGKQLRIAVVAKDDSLSERLSAPTAVRVGKRKAHDRLEFFIKDGDLLESDRFWDVIRQTHADSLRGW